MGVKVYADNPLRFDFILEGDAACTSQVAPTKCKEAERLISYFLAFLTVPEKDLWVNLSPYEKNRIVPKPLGRPRWGWTCWRRIIF